jgi:hypothetical protein
VFELETEITLVYKNYFVFLVSSDSSVRKRKYRNSSIMLTIELKLKIPLI